MMRRLHGFIMSTDMIVASICFLVFLSIALGGMWEYMRTSKDAQATADTAMLGALITEYKHEVGTYPDALSNLQEHKGQYGPWIKSVPDDAWKGEGQKYIYQHNDTGYIIFSIGKDGESSSSLAAGLSGDDIGFLGK